MSENKNFEYTYSATQQKEIEAIRKKYLPKEENKLEQLKRLDKETEKPGMVLCMTLGIIGSLILGVGMCCTMVWEERLFVPGVIVGILGMIIIGVSYPLYLKVTKKQRAKVADQILALSEELSI